MIKIEDPKLVKLLKDKDTLVTEGRKISVEIEKLEKKIEEYEKEEKKITGKIKLPDLEKEADQLQKDINKMLDKFNKVTGEMTKQKLAGIPKALEKKHKDALKLKEQKERDRNKIALKVQKIKDRAIPMIQKVVKPQLKEFEDIQTAEVRGKVVKVKVYSRLDEWIEAYRKKNK